MSDEGGTRVRFADEADAAVIARIHMTSRRAAMPYLPPQKRSHEQVTHWVTLLLDEVRRHSPDGVSLHVFQQNTEARAFYGRHGFAVVDTSDGDRNMENLPDMTLRWTPHSARLHTTTTPASRRGHGHRVD